MSDQAARSYTHRGSNRARPRDKQNSKVVYKSVVDNPFRVDWPSVPVNLQNSILARVVAMAEGVSELHLHREKQSRKRKRAAAGPRVPKRRKVDGSSEGAVVAEATADAAHDDTGAASSEPVLASSSKATAIPEPPILQHLTFGINEVTKLLEQLARSSRTIITAGQEPSEADTQQPRRYPRLILVCRADIDPPLLIAHIPHLVSACNSARRPDNVPGHMRDDICLVPLPKGAEFSLSEAMGLRRVSVMAIDSSAPELTEMAPLLEQIPTLRSSWLVPPAVHQGKPPMPKQIIPTHIKMLRTTAPKDMKAAKEERARGRAAAKKRRKALKEKGAIPKKVVVGAAKGS
ncbi:hypothetical protein BKA93DRAFT_822016 [Sparassis latifolia]